MANTVYPLAKQRLLEWAAGSNPPAGGADLCVIGVKNTYIYSASHEDLTDVTGSAIVAPEVVITNDTYTSGVVDGDDSALSSLSVGETMDAFIIYFKWPAASLLLAYLDEPSNGSLPQLINSETGTLQFPGEGIFSL